jgi:hypothetical protein
LVKTKVLLTLTFTGKIRTLLLDDKFKYQHHNIKKQCKIQKKQHISTSNSFAGRFSGFFGSRNGPRSFRVPFGVLRKLGPDALPWEAVHPGQLHGETTP